MYALLQLIDLVVFLVVTSRGKAINEVVTTGEHISLSIQHLLNMSVPVLSRQAGQRAEAQTEVYSL